jgi:hypothetical protein
MTPLEKLSAILSIANDNIHSGCMCLNCKTWREVVKILKDETQTQKTV